MCKRSNAGLKYCPILWSILSLRYACVGVPCREAFYERFYADLQARVYATASSHLVLIKAQSTTSISRLSDLTKFTRIAKSVYWGVYARAPESIWNIRQELETTYWNGAKSSISTTVYGIACKFAALTDMEEVHIQKVVRSTERPPHIQIWAPFWLQYRASIFNNEVATERSQAFYTYFKPHIRSKK